MTFIIYGFNIGFDDNNVFEINDGKIIISNQKQAVEFIKMLNDSILKSELTDAEYDSTVKTELAPIEHIANMNG